eukprot:symbB.v1.2.012515.t1/scaffold867.1/size156651/1
MNLEKLRDFNDAAFHKFSPVIPFDPLPSDVFLVGVMGSGITLLTQIAHGLRSNGNMDFEDINEVVPWFHAALMCGQDLDEAQPFNPRLFKTHQLYEKLPETAKFIVLFRQPEAIFWTRYQRYCNSSWTGYAAVPAASISPELYASGMFAHMAGNEVWHFMKSWLSCCVGEDRVLFVTYEDLVQFPAEEIHRIAHFLLPRHRINDELLTLVRKQSSKSFMQEHITKFDDHFVLKHLPVFHQDVVAYGRTPRIPKVTQSQHEELPLHIRQLFEARWRHFLGETLQISSYQMLRSRLGSGEELSEPKPSRFTGWSNQWLKGLLVLLAAAAVLVMGLPSLRFRVTAFLRRRLRGSLIGSRSLLSNQISINLVTFNEILDLVEKERQVKEAEQMLNTALAEEDVEESPWE